MFVKKLYDFFLYKTFLFLVGSTDGGAEPSNEGQYLVKYLPPIMLYFELPPDYPSKKPPNITLACKWLSLEQVSSSYIDQCKKVKHREIKLGECQTKYVKIFTFRWRIITNYIYLEPVGPHFYMNMYTCMYTILAFRSF